MCKHNWIPVLPDAKDVLGPQQLNYVVEKNFLSGRYLADIFYCTLCKRAGHWIKSYRGGIRLHDNNYSIEKANGIRNNYGLPLLDINNSSLLK